MNWKEVEDDADEFHDASMKFSISHLGENIRVEVHWVDEDGEDWDTSREFPTHTPFEEIKKWAEETLKIIKDGFNPDARCFIVEETENE